MRIPVIISLVQKIQWCSMATFINYWNDLRWLVGMVNIFPCVRNSKVVERKFQYDHLLHIIIGNR